MADNGETAVFYCINSFQSTVGGHLGCFQLGTLTISATMFNILGHIFWCSYVCMSGVELQDHMTCIISALVMLPNSFPKYLYQSILPHDVYGGSHCSICTWEGQSFNFRFLVGVYCLLVFILIFHLTNGIIIFHFYCLCAQFLLWFSLGSFVFLFYSKNILKYILLIMPLQLSHFALFIPLCPAYPSHPHPPHLQSMSMAHTYKFFVFYISYTIINLPCLLSIYHL